MAVEVSDAVKDKGKRLLMWAAVAALGVGIAVAAGRAVRLIAGFAQGLAELLGRMFF